MKLLPAGKNILVFLLLSIIILSSCTTTVSFQGPAAHEEFLPPDGFTPAWETVVKGIESFSYGSSYPPFYLSALRIDLGVPEREIVISNGISPIESGNTGKNNFRSKTIEQFMKTNDLIAAINATPFKPYRLSTGSRQTAVGIVLFDGILYSMNNKYDALFITKDNRLILSHPPFILSNQITEAAGGFFIILKEGKNVAKESPRAARSLIGSAKEGKVIFFVTIDGEDSRTGSGATFYESAEWMKVLGAENAINMDGGGSSILALRNKPESEIDILNHPEGRFWRFFQRRIPVFIGIR